jgi:hypothetical protein
MIIHDKSPSHQSGVSFAGPAVDELRTSKIMPASRPKNEWDMLSSSEYSLGQCRESVISLDATPSSKSSNAAKLVNQYIQAREPSDDEANSQEVSLDCQDFKSPADGSSQLPSRRIPVDLETKPSSFPKLRDSGRYRYIFDASCSQDQGGNAMPANRLSEPPERYETAFLGSHLECSGHYCGDNWDQECKELTSLTTNYVPFVGRQAPLIPSTPEVQYYHPQSPWRPKVTRKDQRYIGPWTNKKRGRVEVCTMILIMRLLHRFGLHGLSEKDLSPLPYSLRTYASLSEDKFNNAWKRLELELIVSNPRRTNMYHKPPDVGLLGPRYCLEFDGQVHILNQKLKSEWLLTENHDPLTPNGISKICSLILESAAYPNIQTCNILLAIFNNRRHHDLVDLVFDWFYDGRLRPNEITHIQFLRSFRYRKDQTKFLNYIGLMRGMGSGFMLADKRFPSYITNQMQGRVLPIREGSVALVQAAAPSPLVFEHIILGLLSFCGINRTWDACKNLIECGWGYSYRCLKMLILRCAIESAWDAGLRWWKEAENLMSQGYPIPDSLYAVMLAFCSIAKKNEDFVKLFSDAERRLGMSSSQIAGLVEEQVGRIIKGRSANASLKD